MEDNYQPQLIWQGNSVGILNEPVPDMWYLEGLWISNKTQEAEDFEISARKLDLKEVSKNLDRGIEAFLQDEGGQLTRIVVINLSDENQLFLRRMLNK